MLPDPRIILDRISDHIENVFAHLEFRLDECDELLAVIGRDPDAVLETQEAKIVHQHTQPFSYDATAFGDVEDNHAISAIPAPFLAGRGFHARLRYVQHAPAAFGDLKVFFAVSLHPLYVTLDHEPLYRRARLEGELVALPSDNARKGLKYIRSEHGDR